MANSNHQKVLRLGVKAWNKWRDENPEIKPDLSGLNLSGIDLSDADLTDTECIKTSFKKAILDRVNFSRASLVETDFTGASITFSRFVRNTIQDISFEGASLGHSTLFRGWWNGIKLAETNLYGVTFRDCELKLVDFSRAILMSTVFANVDFRGAIGLNNAYHEGPSTIGIDTLFRSNGKIPEAFLREAGVPEELISYLPARLKASAPINWHSCFISYSTKNQKFAERLHSRMRQAGLRVWFDREDMKGGDYLHTQIDRAIQLHDRLLLVLSKESIQSKWVEREIKRTRKIERAEERRKLFPIRLTDIKTLREWECLDSDTGEDLAEEVRKYHIPDFSNWKNHDAFETAFARLEKDLRTSIGEKAP